MEAPAEASLHGDGEGGLGGLVGELRPLGGDHEAFVVGSGANLGFSVVENQQCELLNMVYLTRLGREFFL